MIILISSLVLNLLLILIILFLLAVLQGWLTIGRPKVPSPLEFDPLKDQYSDGTKPLASFTPDFKKDMKLKYTQTDDEHGLEEVENGN